MVPVISAPPLGSGLPLVGWAWAIAAIKRTAVKEKSRFIIMVPSSVSRTEGYADACTGSEDEGSRIERREPSDRISSRTDQWTTNETHKLREMSEIGCIANPNE